MDDITDLRQQIISIVLEHEDDVIAIQDKIDMIINQGISDFDTRTKELEEKYRNNKESSAEDFQHKPISGRVF
jgi:ABC-type protease/lipase transport system fused ATPase/permease subunit